MSTLSRRLSGSLSPGQPKLVLTLKNHGWSDREKCLEFQPLAFQLLRSQFVDEGDGDEGDRFPCASLKKKTSSLFEDRLHSRILQFLRTLVLIFVLLVGFEERSCIPAGSLPYIRRVICRNLFSLEQRRVVDLRVAEHHPDSILEIQCSQFRILPALVATCE